MTTPARVAFVVPDLAGAGAQRVMLDLARGFVAEGIDVDVVVLTSAAGPLRDDVPDGARLFELGRARVVQSVLPLARHLRRRRPDAVVSCLNHANTATVLAARLARPRVPVVVTHHNHLSTAAARKATRRDRAMPLLLKATFRAADRVVAVSKGVADDLAATVGFPRSRIDVIYNPVDFARLVAAGATPAGHPWLDHKDVPVVLGLGRLVEQKDFESLVRAVALVPDVRLVIAGEGDQRASLERAADDLGVAARTDLCGFVDNPYAFLRRADVFVLSSRWEGLPTVLVEALAFPPRIVATDCPAGPAEILTAGRGRLVPVGDVGALGAAIEEALAAGPRPDWTDDHWRHDPACARYEPSTVTKQYLDVLPAARPAR